MTLTLDRMEIRLDRFTLTADMRIPGGARIAVIGPSGAGKSTLLAAIAGFVRPASGRILWNGKDMTDTRPGDRPLSILFQDQNLFPHLTAEANVALGLRPSLRLARSEWAQVRSVLRRVGLEGQMVRKPGTLSGGEQARVALARVMLRRRPMLLLDEPFAALGPALRAEMLALIGEAVADSGATLLMVSHDPEDARRLCPQAVLVAEGRAHAPRETAALLDHPPEVLAAYLGKAKRAP